MKTLICLILISLNWAYAYDELGGPTVSTQEVKPGMNLRSANLESGTVVNMGSMMGNIYIYLVDITDENLRGAIYDNSTRLPDRFGSTREEREAYANSIGMIKKKTSFEIIGENLARQGKAMVEGPREIVRITRETVDKAAKAVGLVQ